MKVLHKMPFFKGLLPRLPRLSIIMSSIGELGGDSCCNFGMVGFHRLEYNFFLRLEYNFFLRLEYNDNDDVDHVKGSGGDDDINLGKMCKCWVKAGLVRIPVNLPIVCLSSASPPSVESYLVCVTIRADIIIGSRHHSHLLCGKTIQKSGSIAFGPYSPQLA